MSKASDWFKQVVSNAMFRPCDRRQNETTNSTCMKKKNALTDNMSTLLVSQKILIYIHREILLFIAFDSIFLWSSFIFKHLTNPRRNIAANMRYVNSKYVDFGANVCERVRVCMHAKR